MAGKKNAKKSGKEEAREIDAQEAMRVIQEQQQKRVEMCRAEIQEVLQRHNCQLTAEILLRQGQVIPNVVVVPVNPQG